MSGGELSAEMVPTLTHEEHRRWMEIAEADGWDVVRADALWHCAVEAVAWELIEQTSDTSDRGPSDETMRAAYVTARALLDSLRSSRPAPTTGREADA